MGYSIWNPYTPMEDFGKVYHRGGVNFQMHLIFCVIFISGLSQRE